MCTLPLHVDFASLLCSHCAPNTQDGAITRMKPGFQFHTGVRGGGGGVLKRIRGAPKVQGSNGL